MQEKTEEAMAYVLFRGEYDKRRDEVKPATPDVLPPMPDDLPRNRLGFAQWLLRPEHPLTARVTVNRFWQEVFGTGLVRTAGDFGVAGELPSHPELLDWLAVEFRESGWDVKQFFKLMVTSATYRQAAIVDAGEAGEGPATTGCCRAGRGSAWMPRWSATTPWPPAACWCRKIGGPSVKPYQPDGVWEAVAMIGSNTRDYKRDTGENLYRRSMYTFWKRARPAGVDGDLQRPEPRDLHRPPRADQHAAAGAGDAERPAVRRSGPAPGRSGRSRRAATTTTRRLDFVAKRLLARPFRAEELPIVQGSRSPSCRRTTAATPTTRSKLIAVGESKADAALDPAELAAWTMLANELMNLDEVLNK